jgi:acetoin utilization deacetylase AcuC-like enzyme
MASMLLDLSEKRSGGKIAFVLEGGYDLTALKNSVATVLHKLEGNQKGEPPPQGGGEAIETLIRRVLQVQEKYW